MPATNDDLFFIKSTDEGALEVKVLKLYSESINDDDNDIYESYPIANDELLMADLIRKKRVRKTGEK